MSAAGRRRTTTPDSHAFPTRPYDLVKEFVVALVVVAALTLALAVAFGSPDEKAISLQDWAKAAPNDVVATAAAQLSGDSTTAGYGPPYNSASDGQKLLGLPLQKWGGVRYPIDAANDFVIDPLRSVQGSSSLTAALDRWTSASPDQQAAWAGAYVTALSAAPDGDPAKVASGDYGPVPTLSTSYERLAVQGGLEQLVSKNAFYGGDPRVDCCCWPTAATSRTRRGRAASAATSGG